MIRAAKKYDLNIPDHLMVIGFDNLDITSMTCPSITTISQSSYQAGYSSNELLMDIIEQPGFLPRPIILDTELILRESTRGY